MVLVDFVVFFFFSQNTAYEMRISDWSSDVCSSDLYRSRPRAAATRVQAWPRHPARPSQKSGPEYCSRPRHCDQGPRRAWSQSAERYFHPPLPLQAIARLPVPWRHIPRSEEHTSELQSLMRISYAVFCLKKKNKNTKNTLIANTT